MGKKIIILIAILILSNMSAFLYVLVWDASLIVTKPGYYNETVTRLGMDAVKNLFLMLTSSVPQILFPNL